MTDILAQYAAREAQLGSQSWGPGVDAVPVPRT